MRTYAIDRLDTMTPTLRSMFIQYRTRLDMYCMLVFVFLVLAASAAALMVTASLTRFAVGFVPAYLLLALVSYRAAVFSARGVNDIVGSIRDAQPAGPAQGAAGAGGGS